jgi:organic radical activating enzyme
MTRLAVREGRVINPEGLEVNATMHCNMRCVSCSHLAPLYRRANTDPAALATTLTVLAKHYHAAYTKILGGEPLLHPQLLDVIEAVRSSGVCDTVLVCTNGTLLHRAPAAFWAAVDSIEISVYPSRPIGGAEHDRFRALAREHGVDLVVNHYGHFRVAYAETPARSTSLVREIFDTYKLAHVWLSHTVHNGWLYRCPQSVALPEQLEHADWASTVDALEIVDDPAFLDRLVEFVHRSTPLRACRNCLGSVGKLHPHVEVSRRQWRQHDPVDELVDRAFLARARADITVDDGCVDDAAIHTARSGP